MGWHLQLLEKDGENSYARVPACAKEVIKTLFGLDMGCFGDAAHVHCFESTTGPCARARLLIYNPRWKHTGTAHESAKSAPMLPCCCWVSTRNYRRLSQAAP